jgi:pyridine nucleotide-disulfide oxidoreductase family protein
VKRLLLLGGGHAHLEVVRQFGVQPANPADVEIVWASPGSHTAYSGVLPGVVAGHYRPEDMLIDLAALAKPARCKFISQSIVALESAQRRVVLGDGSRIDYDLLSLNTGSITDIKTVPGTAEHAISLRPFDAFVRAWKSLFDDANTGKDLRIAIVGGGAGGVEIALAVSYRLQREPLQTGRCHVTLVTDTPTVLPGYPQSAQQKFAQLLAKSDIDTRCGSPVTKVTADAITTAAGDAIAADCVIWATTGAAPAWLRAAGIATDAHGFAAVDSRLRSTSNPEIFGGGDIVTMMASPHPKSGVYAVRHGPVLAANLRAALDGGKLVPYAPRRRALSLLSAGDKYAVGVWGPWMVAGNWVWAWKNRIDRDFVAKYRASPKHA